MYFLWVCPSVWPTERSHDKGFISCQLPLLVTLTWTSLGIICSPGPSLEKPLPGNCIEMLQAKCSSYVSDPKTKKTKKQNRLSDGWSFGSSPVWMRQKGKSLSLSQCGTSDNRNSYFLESACVDKYALWWAGSWVTALFQTAMCVCFGYVSLLISQPQNQAKLCIQKNVNSLLAYLFVAAQRAFSKRHWEKLRSKQWHEDSNLALRNLAKL